MFDIYKSDRVEAVRSWVTRMQDGGLAILRKPQNTPPPPSAAKTTSAGVRLRKATAVTVSVDLPPNFLRSCKVHEQMAADGGRRVALYIAPP